MASDSGLDRYLAMHYGAKSIAELSEITGVPEADIATRVRAYYDNTILTAEDQYAQQVLQLRELVSESLQRAKNAGDRDGSAWATSGKNALQALSKLQSDWERRQAENSAERDAIYARQLLRIVERAVDRSIGSLVERFEGADRDEIEAEFQKNLMLVAAEVDAGEQ